MTYSIAQGTQNQTENGRLGTASIADGCHTKQEFDQIAFAILADLMAAEPANTHSVIVQALRDTMLWHGASRAWLAMPLPNGQFTILQTGQTACPEQLAASLAELGPRLMESKKSGVEWPDPTVPDAAFATLMAEREIGSAIAIRVGLAAATLGVFALEADVPGRLKGICEWPSIHTLSAAMGQSFLTACAANAQNHTESQLRATLETIPCLALELQPDNRCLAVYVSEHTGFPFGFISPNGLKIEDVLPLAISRSRRSLMQEAAKKGISQCEKFVLPSIHGPRQMQVAVSRIASSSSSCNEGFVFVIREATNDLALERQIKRLVKVVERTPNFVVIADADGAIEWVNKAYEVRSGYMSTDLCGRYIGDLVALAQPNPEPHKRISEALRDHASARADLVCETKCGDSYWVEVDVQPLFDDDGTFSGSLMIQTDITERWVQQAEVLCLANEVRESRDKLHAVVTAMPNAFAAFDAEDRLMIFNQNYAQLYPASAATLAIGDTFSDIVKARVLSGELPQLQPDEVSWLAQGPKQRSLICDGREEQLPDGRWVTTIEKEIRGGGRVCLHADITQLKGAEQRLLDVIEGARVGTWELDLNTMVEQSNEIWAENLGYYPNEIGSVDAKTWENLAHPEDVPKMRKALEDCVAGNIDTIDLELRMRHRAGHNVWLRTKGRVSKRTAGGKPLALSGLDMDISALKAREAQLELATNQLRAANAKHQAAHERFANISEASRFWIWEQDESLRFTYLSEGYRALTGNDPAILIGKTRAQLFETSPEVRANSNWSGLSEKLERHEAFSDFVYKVIPQDPLRSHIWVQISGKPVFDAVGRFCGYHGVGGDVTVVREATERAEQANRAKSAFLATMSHEIRTPLNGILGMAEVLKETLSDPESQIIVKTISESGELLLTILNQILDIAKIEAGKLTLEQTLFIPADLVRRLEPIYALHAQGKGISFQTELHGNVARPRMGDPTRLSQILHNLLGNAIKFTSIGQIRLIMRADDTGTIEFEIRDTGIGMSKEQARRVFLPFEQADSGTTRRYGGTGLGLGVVRGLIEQMGGRIYVASTPNKGTRMRFVLALPFADMDAKADHNPVESEGAKLASPGILHGISALVADDNATNRLIMKSMLSALGITFVMVEDGAQAVEAWKSGTFDILLLDISMPVVDGPAALSQICAVAQANGAKRPKSIAITANAMPHQVVEYLALGFDDHVAKPVKKEHLRLAVEKQLFGP